MDVRAVDANRHFDCLLLVMMGTKTVLRTVAVTTRDLPTNYVRMQSKWIGFAVNVSALIDCLFFRCGRMMIPNRHISRLQKRSVRIGNVSARSLGNATMLDLVGDDRICGSRLLQCFTEGISLKAAIAVQKFTLPH